MARTMSPSGRFAVFDDDWDHRHDLIEALALIPGSLLVAEGRVDEAVVSVAARKPDLVVTAIHRPTSERLEYLRSLRRAWRYSRLVILMPVLPPFPEWWLDGARRLGIGAFAYYTDGPATLRRTVVGDPAALDSAINALTPREREVADLVGQGLLDKEIARRLVISESTVGNHLRSIFAKLGVTNRRELIRRSMERAAETNGTAAPGPESVQELAASRNGRAGSHP